MVNTRPGQSSQPTSQITHTIIGDFGFLVFVPVNNEKIVVNALSTSCATWAKPGTKRLTMDDTTFNPPACVQDIKKTHYNLKKTQFGEF